MNDFQIKSQVSRVMLAAVLAGASILSIGPSVLAHDPPVYDRGTLLSMDSQSCGTTQNGGKTVAGEILGTDSEKSTTEQVLCQDYVLQAEHIVYRIRLKDGKHPVLLPVGDSVEFRIEKSSLFLRDPETNQKEREYTVISMQPRTDVKDARNEPPSQ
jgi:D-serine deaminase-like pyridoxal phosphate-dependent protein